MSDKRALPIEILKNLVLFNDLDHSALEKMADLFQERVFRRGEVIFAEDTIGSSMMVIISGEVRISQLTPMSAEETLVVLKRGDFFGEMALLEEMPRSATAIAHSDIYLLEIGREAFLHYVTAHPTEGVKMLLALSRTLSGRLREADLKIKAFINLTQWV